MNSIPQDLYQSLTSFIGNVSKICNIQPNTFSLAFTPDQELKLKACLENYYSHLSSFNEIKQCNWQKGFMDEITYPMLAQVISKQMLMAIPSIIAKFENIHSMITLSKILTENPNFFLHLNKEDEANFISISNILLAFFERRNDDIQQYHYQEEISLYGIREMQFQTISVVLLEKLEKFLVSPLAIHYFGYMEKLKATPREQAIDWFKEHFDKEVESEMKKVIEAHIHEIVDQIAKKQIKFIREKREEVGESTFYKWPRLLTNKTVLIFNNMDTKMDDWSHVGQCFFALLHVFIEIYKHFYCFAAIYFKLCSEIKVKDSEKDSEIKEKLQIEVEETKNNLAEPDFHDNLEQDWALETHIFGVMGFDSNAMKEETAQFILDEKNWGDRKAMQEYVKTQRRSFRSDNLKKPLKTFRWIYRKFEYRKCSCSWCGTMETYYAGDEVNTGNNFSIFF